MVKLVYCLRRRADISRQEFHRYWRDVHGSKVKSMADALQAHRYIQSHTCAAELNQLLAHSRGLAPGYDGVTEIWWKNVEELQAAMNSSAGANAMAMLLEDESRFIDFSQSCAFLTTEHSIFDRSLT
jgi:hypothetical protein